MWTPEHRRAADRHGLRYPSDLTDAEMPPSLSGMSWMVKYSIGGVGELCGAVAPVCMSSIYFSVLHDRRPRIQAAANKAEYQKESYQAGLFRANAEVESSSMR
jgi:hypothetical protein